MQGNSDCRPPTHVEKLDYLWSLIEGKGTTELGYYAVLRAALAALDNNIEVEKRIAEEGIKEMGYGTGWKDERRDTYTADFHSYMT